MWDRDRLDGSSVAEIQSNIDLTQTFIFHYVIPIV